LRLILWEDFLDVVSRTRLQDEYNKAIRECDVFVMLFFSKVGKYTEEEFETAFGQFQATNRPFIFTYFKDAENSNRSTGNIDSISLRAFQEKLDALGHFYTRYTNIDQLKLHFSRQLDKLVESGFIEFRPNEDENASLGNTTYTATLVGNGAIAQGAGTAVGARGVSVGGKNTGNISTGTQTNTTQGGAVVQGSVEVGGHFIGRDFIQTVTQVVHSNEDPDEAKSVIAHYLYALANDLTGLKLGEIDVAAKETSREPLQLADVYVPLDIHLHIPEDMTLEEWLSSRRGTEHRALDRQQETRRVGALEALAAHKQLTLLGKPGSGKSTFGTNILLTLAQGWQGHHEELARLGESWEHDAPLPIRVILRRFAEQLPPGDAPVRAGDLWTFIRRDLSASGYGLSDEAIKYVQRIVRSHGALMLLDGLDECGHSTTRKRVLDAVQEVMRTAGPKCRFLLTARPYAWPDGPNPSQGVYSLADLDDEQIEQFIRAWYSALENRKWLSPQEAESKTVDLLEARHRYDLLPLTRNPLLLTLTATLHANRGRLPEDRADLYNESVDLLMLRWNRQIGADKALLDELEIPTLKLSDLREVLEELAFKVHEENVEQGEGADLAQTRVAETQVDGTADIGEDRLVRAFRPLLNDSRDKAAVVVDYIEKRAGLLIGQGERAGERQFTFPHRTFQEFLAASYLAAQDDFPAECARLARTAPGQWQVVLPLAARMAKAERGASAADELVNSRSITDARADRQPDAGDWTCALLAGMQLIEIGVGAIKKRERTQAIAARVADWLATSLSRHPDEGGLTAAQRAQAGDVLVALGDPRFDPLRCYLPADDSLGFVRIPADTDFRIGTRKSDVKRVTDIIGTDVPDDEINDIVTPTREFYIARYPVTVAQFRTFVETTGFSVVDTDALRDPDSRPVRYVSWHEALAYCDWLNGVLCDPQLPDDIEMARLVREHGWRVALPSELEWEKAARGGLRHTVFSWGDAPDGNRANYSESEIGDTSVVGCFPCNGFG
ncbi:MAG: SUMF1/EgtB/PvdO family nonheme iron enzyme, partial [Gammaproteobacteria bacterium]|nr:SUMF1/EgtB/PvdO family nonheme iron enzyme [Gammaproteobacteria bacterium]